MGETHGGGTEAGSSGAPQAAARSSVGAERDPGCGTPPPSGGSPTDERTTLAELRAAVAGFVAEREWQRYHDPKNLSMSLAIEAAELMEHFQWVRSDELDALLREEGRRGAIADEVADVACYLFALANVLELDLAAEVTRKLGKNAEKYPAEKFRGRYYKPGRDSGH